MIHSNTKELQAAIKDEAETFGGAMSMVYEEMSKLHHTVAPILAIQTNTKERYAMLKEVITTLDNIHEWTTKYPEALRVLLKKDWITT